MMSKKIKCALIGPGNIGTDLLAKLQRSPVLEPVWMVGIDPTSDGLKRAREMGIKTTAEGVDGLVPHIRQTACRSSSTPPAPTCMPRTAARSTSRAR
jgi:acetaldehyde/propanal dehydrogenase